MLPQTPYLVIYGLATTQFLNLIKVSLLKATLLTRKTEISYFELVKETKTLRYTLRAQQIKTETISRQTE